MPVPSSGPCLQDWTSPEVSLCCRQLPSSPVSSVSTTSLHNKARDLCSIAHPAASSAVIFLIAGEAAGVPGCTSTTRLLSARHGLDSSSKGPERPLAPPPRVSPHGVWLSALEQPGNSVLLCSISTKSLAGKRFMTGRRYSSRAREQREPSPWSGRDGEPGLSPRTPRAATDLLARPHKCKQCLQAGEG